MNRIIFATGNENKMKEIKEMFIFSLRPIFKCGVFSLKNMNQTACAFAYF